MSQHKVLGALEIQPTYRRVKWAAHCGVMSVWGICAGVLLAASTAHAANVIEAGVGWENQGAIQGKLQWLPSIQGSRKDVPVFVGWRHMGNQRVFWAPSARMTVANFWSIGGGGNFLGVTVAPAGIGVYFTPPPAAYSPEARQGHWFVSATLSASLQLGGNATPNSPTNDSIPDPEAHRTDLRARIASGVGIDVLKESQHYPLGSYAYAAVGLPLRIDVSRTMTQQIGAGFFIEANPMLLEWQLSSDGNATPAYGYSMTAGFSVSVY